MCGTADLVMEHAAARGPGATLRVVEDRSQDATHPCPAPTGDDSAAWQEVAALPDALLGAERALAGWRPPASLHQAARLQVIACAASLPAATMARDAMERAAGIPVDLASATAFRRRAPTLPPGTAIVMLGASDETADLQAGQRMAASQGLPMIGIGPLPDVAMGQSAAVPAPLLGGRSFPAQVHALLRLGIALGEAAGRGDATFREDLGWALASTPVVLAAALTREARLHPLATRLAAAAEVLLIGHGAGAALAQAGALELTQRTALHATCVQVPGVHPKHPAAGWPPRLPPRPLRPGTPVIFCAPSDAQLPAALADARLLRAQGADVTVLADASSAAATRVIAEEAGLEMVALPGTGIAGCLAIAVALQLLALQVAEAQGAGADRPHCPVGGDIAAWAAAA